MKTLLYTLFALLLFSACRSVEKLVEKGQYDEAIVLAARKLAGKKKKKTKHVKALEKAFSKITADDMRRIEALDAENNPHNWKRVLDITRKIEKRQNRVSPFLPLISNEGYEAGFTFVNTIPLRNKALDRAAEYHYAIAKELLISARAKDSYGLAQDAYYEFEKVEFYRTNYKNTNELMRDSRHLGIVNIFIDFRQDRSMRLEEELLLQGLGELYNRNMNSFWKRYYFEADSSMNYDFASVLNINHVDISPERELVNNHIDTKKVKDGWEYIKGKNGMIKTDSLGNKLKRDIFIEVRAMVTEIVREKSSFAELEIVTIDLSSNRVHDSAVISYENEFRDLAVQFRGDRRALCNSRIDHIKDFPLAFPPDYDMILDTAYKMQDKIYREIKSIRV